MIDNGTPSSYSDSEMAFKENKNRLFTFKSKRKCIVIILKNRTMHCLRIGKKIRLCTKAIKVHAQF